MKLDPSQERAVELVCSAPIGIVTGGAGVGKSTCLRIALDRLEESGVTVSLAAPTGKAAKRLAEATGREAQTIHRLLEYHPFHGFRRDRNRCSSCGGKSKACPDCNGTGSRPLECDLVVIDEASMVDIELADSLLNGIDSTRTRLILVGDHNQLPPVGPGAFFRDLLASEAVRVARLTKVHRAAEESWICTQAPGVITGTKPNLEPRHDFRFIEAETLEDVGAAVLRAVQDHPKDAGELVVLSPQKTTSGGVVALNETLRGARNPKRIGVPEWPIGASYTARPRDLVIQRKNDYTREVFNGETGVVIGETSGKGGKLLEVQFDGRVVKYDRPAARNLHLAYALTVHASQGSEWPWIIVVCHSGHTHMLSRPLLYTALTRARTGVVLIGNQKGLDAALKASSAGMRNTELAEHLRGG